MEELPRRLRVLKSEKVKRRRRLGLKILVGCFLLFILWHLALWIYHQASLKMVKTTLLYPGTLEEGFDIDAIVIRDEVLLTAPVSGNFIAAVQQGERVPVGGEIGRIDSQGISRQKYIIAAPRAGLISFYPDGLEDLLSPKVFEELRPKEIERIMKEQPKVTKENQVTGGEPIGKIINNLEPCFLLFRLPQGKSALPKGRDFIVAFGTDKKISVQVEKSIAGDDATWQVMRTMELVPEFYQTRTIKLKLITECYQGLLLPAKALVIKNGKDGVYLLKKGKIYWKNIEVKGKVEQMAVISGLEIGTEVITTPALVREGQYLWR